MRKKTGLSLNYHCSEPQLFNRVNEKLLDFSYSKFSGDWINIGAHMTNSQFWELVEFIDKVHSLGAVKQQIRQFIETGKVQTTKGSILNTLLLEYVSHRVTISELTSQNEELKRENKVLNDKLDSMKEHSNHLHTSASPKLF